MKYMVFDVGGTEIKYSVMTGEAQMLLCGSVPTPLESQEAFLEGIARLYAQYGAGTEGIAISMPGQIDADSGFCYTGGWLAFNQGKPVAQQISQLCGCPVHIDNDGKCAALAEFTSGSLVGTQNSAVFLIGTGVGGGLICNGKLLRGKHFCAGEFSFLCQDYEKWNQLESLVGHCCATTGLLADLRRGKGLSEDVPLTGKDAFRMVSEGDAQAKAALKRLTDRIAFQIFNFQMLLDLERIAIGGGISRQDILMESISDSFQALLDNAYEGMKGLVSQTVEIVRCKYGPEANQIGALQSYLLWAREQEG